MKFLKLLKNNIHWLLLLLLLQGIVVFALLSVQLFYQPRIAENLLNIIDYMHEMNKESDDGMMNLGDSPMELYNSYKSVKNYFFKVVISSLVVLLILNNLNWFFSISVLRKKPRYNYFLRFGIITLIFSALLYLLFYLQLKIVFSDIINNQLPVLRVLFAFISLIIILYYTFIFYSLADEKKFIKKALRNGLNKIYIILPLQILFAIIVFLSFYLVYLASDSGVVILLLSLFLSLAVLVLTKLSLIHALEKIAK